MIRVALTLHLMFLTTLLTFASQNAPLYLALTSVPTERKGGSSPFTFSGCQQEKEEREKKKTIKSKHGCFTEVNGADTLQKK